MPSDFHVVVRCPDADTNDYGGDRLDPYRRTAFVPVARTNAVLEILAYSFLRWIFFTQYPSVASTSGPRSPVARK